MALQGKTILIVDDAPDIRLLTRKILENSGLSVLESESVEGALELLKAQVPHLILLDLSLPGKSGFQFLEERRTNPAWAGIPVIVASGARDRDSVFKSIALGAADYLIKPFQAARLIQKIRKSLRDRDFISKKFDENSRPEVQAEIEATITQVFESSFLLKSQIRISPKSVIQLSADEFANAGIAQCVFVTDEESRQSGSDGFYPSHVKVLGLKEPITRKLGGGA